MSGAEPFLLLAGAGISAAGAISSANAESAAMKRQAQIDDRNATLARQDRQLNARTAEIAEEDKRRENRRRLAEIRNNYGSTGLEFSGSPFDALLDTSTEMALDERRIGFEGLVRNREGLIEEQNYKDSAAGNRQGAKNAKTAGYYSAGASLLSGGGRAAGAF